MSEPVWNQFLTERDKAVFATSGYGARGGFGKRPALLVIDVNWAFCGDRPEPILESIKRWRNSCGEDAWVALPYIRSLIDKCHDKGVPVHLHHRRAPRRQLGFRLLELEELAQRGGSSDRRDQSRRQRDRHPDRAGAAGHRGATSRSRRASSAPTWRAI